MSPIQTPFDVLEVHEVAILVTTSSLNSSSSTSTGLHTLPVPESSLNDACPSPGAPIVKFAPLPQVDPSRKRFLAPLGVPGRSRRINPVIQQEGGSLLWSIDPDVPEEQLEDPIISFAKFVKKTGKTLWRRVRKRSKVVAQETVAFCAEPVLDIKSTVGTVGKGENVMRAVGLERRASWSPLAERRTLGGGKVQRKSTSDLPRVS